MARLDIKDFRRVGKISNLQEFKDDINVGIDQNIFIGDALFWLGAGKHGVCAIGQCPDGDTLFYKDADDLLCNFIFDGKCLMDWIPQIDYADV